MAEHWYPCPQCGQQQRTKAAAGEVIVPKLCPACEEIAGEAEELAQLVEREAAPRPSSRKGK